CYLIPIRPSLTATHLPYTTLFRSGLDLDKATGHIVVPGYTVKNEEFWLRAEVSGVTQTAGLEVGFSALGQGAWVTVVAFHVRRLDRKSTRLNSSHVKISYAVFCLK